MFTSGHSHGIPTIIDYSMIRIFIPPTLEKNHRYQDPNPGTFFFAPERTESKFNFKKITKMCNSVSLDYGNIVLDSLNMAFRDRIDI